MWEDHPTSDDNRHRISAQHLSSGNVPSRPVPPVTLCEYVKVQFKKAMDQNSQPHANVPVCRPSDIRALKKKAAHSSAKKKKVDRGVVGPQFERGGSVRLFRFWTGPARSRQF
jgi:hypothetical protein